MFDEPLRFAQRQGGRDQTTVLEIHGPLTLGNLFGFQGEFRQMRPSVLIVDMSGVHYMDSAGLGLLLNGYVSAQNDGRKYLLVGVNQRVLALLEMTRVHQVLAIHPTVEDAEAAL